MIEGFELYIFYNIRSINTFQLLWKRGECLCVVVTLCLLLPSLGWELNGDYRKYCRALSSPQPQGNRLTDSGSHFATLVYRKYVILPLSHFQFQRETIFFPCFTVISWEQIPIALLLPVFFFMKRSPLLLSFHWDMLTLFLQWMLVIYEVSVPITHKHSNNPGSHK